MAHTTALISIGGAAIGILICATFPVGILLFQIAGTTIGIIVSAALIVIRSQG